MQAWTDLARRQHGVVTRAQLLGAGTSRRVVERWLATGRLVPFGRGVYLVAGAPRTRRQTLAGVLLLAGPDAALTGATAAEVLGLHGVPRTARVSVAVPVDRAPPRIRRDDVVVRRSRWPVATTTHCTDGLRHSTATRAVAELAREADDHLVAELVAEVLRRRLATTSTLLQLVGPHGGGAGAARLRRVLRDLDPAAAATRSGRELQALGLLLAAGLPRPQVNWCLTEHGRLVKEIDLAWPDLRVAVEVDGDRWHRTPAAKRRDEAARNALSVRGWLVLVVAADDVVARPHTLVRAVRRALEARRAG